RSGHAHVSFHLAHQLNERCPVRQARDPASTAGSRHFFMYGSRSVWGPIIFHVPFSLRNTLVARIDTICALPPTLVFSPFSPLLVTARSLPAVMRMFSGLIVPPSFIAACFCHSASTWLQPT